LDERVLDWALLGLARTYIYLNDYENAISELQQVLVLNNNCVPAYDLLAECHQHQGDSKKMQSQLTQAVRLAPLSIKRQKDLGDICVVNQDYESSSQAFRSAIRSAKNSINDSSDSYLKLAASIADSMQGDLSKADSAKLVEAQRVLAEVVERFEEDDLIVRRGLVNVRLQINQQNPTRAQSLMSELEEIPAIVNGQLDNQSLFDMAKTWLSLGDEAKANVAFTELMQRSDLDASKHLAIKALKKEFGSVDMSERASEMNERAALLYEEHKLKESIDLFTEASRLSPRSVVVNLNLTQALLLFMETEEYSLDYRKKSVECLKKVGKLPEDSRHFTRFSSLSQRVKELDARGPLEN
jgi:tetratricopeptide (TPR) repeat protein